MTPSGPLLLPALPRTGNLWRTGQLHEEGLNSRAIKLLLQQGRIVRLRYGCYIRAELWQKQTAATRSKQLIHAHAYGTLTTSTIGHLRVTSLVRTVVDCAMMLGYQQALVLMDHALRLGADHALMEAMADGLPGRRGIRNLRAALANADPRSESAGETLTRELLVRLKLPLPEPQVEVNSRAGRYRLDFAWKEKKVALEFDGKVKYFEYKPTAEVLFQERQRESALTEDGWTFVRVKWKDLFHEQEFKARILTALRR